MVMDESVKPCIQDRLRSIISRARDLFASLPILCLTIPILIFITLAHAYAVKVISLTELSAISEIFSFFLAFIMSCLAIKGYDKLKIEIGRIEKVEVKVDARGSTFLVPPIIDSPQREEEEI